MIYDRLISIPARAVLLVLTVALASLAFWKSHGLLERSHLHKMTAAHAQTVRLDIIEEIQYCLRGQVQLARLLENDRRPEAREHQVRLFLRDHPGFLDEQWVDPAFHVRWSVAESTVGTSQDVPPGPDPALQSLLTKLTDRRDNNTTFTPPFPLANGDSARRIVVPVYHQDQLIGFSIATVDREKLFGEILEDQAGAGYGLSVADANQQVYTSGIAFQKESEWVRIAEFSASGLPLRVRIWPEPNLLSGNRAMLIELSLAAGAVIGLLFFIVLELAITWHLQSQELRKSRDELDLRVQQRTAELRSINEALEIEIHERKQTQESFQELSGRVLHLRDQEQRRIGRELHDSTVQTLAALVIYLERLELSLANGDRSKAPKLLAMSRNLAEHVTAELRTISYLMHPPMLDDLGLEIALPWYAAGFTARSGIQTNVRVQPELGRFSQETELTLYRVAQEALTNIHRHSGSLTADISLLRDADQVALRITDCGRGIPCEVLEHNSNSGALIGVGIAGMRERVRQLNGSLEIESSHRGTTIKIMLPIELKQVSELVKNRCDITIQPNSESQPKAELIAIGKSA